MLRAFLSLTAVVLIALTSKSPLLKHGKLERPLIPRAELLTVAAAGSKVLAADYLFIRMLYHSGAARAAEEYRQLSDYAQVITQLDPDLQQVYSLGGSLIPVNVGRERWLNVTEALALLRRGFERFPHERRIGGLLAFTLAFCARDYAAAAKVFSAMAELPDAPAFYKPLSIRLMAQGGQFGDARQLAEAMAETAPDEETRAFYAHRVKLIDQERVLTEVDRAVASFRVKFGKSPTSVNELWTSGELKELPVDPLGGRVYLDSNGVARSSQSWYRFQMYETRKKLQLTEVIGKQEEFIPQTND